ncbi:flagellin lysine-N-methylase [Bacillus thuringiensis]|nr:flagellin lysine-N-methylase [Bacillus thuringiensis]
MKQHVKMSNYLQRFSCIGSQCEDTCCGNWTIHVDKTSYLNYKQLDQTKQSNLLHAIKKNEDAIGENDYAIIQLQENHMCPFLTNNKLCNIQIKYGYQSLCRTCQVYPRTVTKVNADHFETAYLSCPEIARLVLLSSTSFKWKQRAYMNIEESLSYKEITLNQTVLKKMQEVIMYFFLNNNQSYNV